MFGSDHFPKRGSSGRIFLWRRYQDIATCSDSSYLRCLLWLYFLSSSSSTRPLNVVRSGGVLVCRALPCSWTWLWDLIDISFATMNDIFFDDVVLQSKMLSEKKVFLSTFHRFFRRNFNPVYFQMVSGFMGPDSHAARWLNGGCQRGSWIHSSW